MGGNGDSGTGILEYEENREFREVYAITNDIRVIERKNSNLSPKMPEESHTPGRVYVLLNAFFKPGQEIKGIAKYGKDGKKMWSIHTAIHKELKDGHYHIWKDGRPIGRPMPLTKRKRELLEFILGFKNKR